MSSADARGASLGASADSDADVAATMEREGFSRATLEREGSSRATMEREGFSRAEPGVYVGWLRHRRFSPKPHAFTYPLFMVLLDVDRIGEQLAVSRFTSWNRFNWATFDDRDHFGEPSRPLRERVAADAARNGVTLPDGRIFLLTHLRYLGYCFNPVSFFYCFDREDRLRLVCAEVNNTFGGSHNYWVQPHDRAAKALYVRLCFRT